MRSWGPFLAGAAACVAGEHFHLESLIFFGAAAALVPFLRRFMDWIDE